jgi:hypothetical protein
MQNNSELKLHHSEREREDWKGKVEKDGKEFFSACAV